MLALLLMFQGDVDAAREILTGAREEFKALEAIAYTRESNKSSGARHLLARPYRVRTEWPPGEDWKALSVIDGDTGVWYGKGSNEFGPIGKRQHEIHWEPIPWLFFGGDVEAALKQMQEIKVESGKETVLRWKATHGGEYALWLTADSMPSRLERRSDGIEEVSTFTDVDRAPDASPERFAFKVPEDAERRHRLDVSDVLLPPIGASLRLNVSSFEGQSLQMGDFAGKTVLVCVWDLYNEHEHQQLATAQRISDEFSGRGVVVLPVMAFGSGKSCESYFDKQGLTMSGATGMVLGAAGKTHRMLEAPATFLVGPDGKIVYRACIVKERRLKKAIEGLLDRQP